MVCVILNENYHQKNTPCIELSRKGLQKLTFYDKITFKKDYFWHSQIFFSYNNTKAMYHYM